MNFIQKIILLLGAIALGMVIFLTPKVYYYKELKLKTAINSNQAPQLDLDTILIYGGTIVLVTIALVLITHTKKK